ncbi:cytochrome P450 [Dactylonectria macrodidyma]|uniref:Cytochrome P450 n=1 Tax=Dactylonectria macrodidyma TaxID=307937 RepID=A0A9P9J7Y3_9HYPO|nr:cytochrome P450 [Dactylonectria macrodidyma]
MQSVLALTGIITAFSTYSYISKLRHNIAEAKRSGLPYIVAPCSPIFLPWQITHKLWLPIIRSFPKSWWEEWLDPLIPGFTYRTRHERFARHGDIFIVVSPGMLFLMVANAEVVCQLTSKPQQFPKLTETYEILRQFGDNVLTSPEGPVWRMHRKVTSASFNEKNTAIVFKEAIRQAQGMLRTWTGPTGERNETINSLDVDTMRLALNIIAYAGFGLELLWPGEKLPEGADQKLAKYGSLEPAAGHKLSFVDTIATMLEYILLLLLVPGWVLRLIPFQKIQRAADSREDWIKYMRELLDEKIEEAGRGERVEGMDLMGRLVRSSYGAGQKSGEAVPKKGTLAREEILGNAFIMLVAGHETTANAMHFILIELATNPASQRRLHKDIDEMFGDTDPSTWDYDSLINPMLASMLGACLNETLRMMPAVVEIPKKVTPDQDQVIVMDGQKHVLPKRTMISLVAVSVHRNPRYWPARPSKIHTGKDDINDWVPERWFRNSQGATDKTDTKDDSAEEDLGEEVTSAELFRPERGSYIPFSDGPRSCLGRRIAQVEIIAALAVLFRSHSLELAVDEWATDEEVNEMSRDERASVYKSAQKSSRAKLARAVSVLTLKLDGEHVPVRLVRRGEERFVDWVDE